MTKNYLRMIFVLQQRTYFQHPCRINWTTKVSIITLCLKKNGVNLCPSWMKNIIESELWIKSKAAPDNSDCDASARVPHKKKEMNGVLHACDQQGKKISNNKVSQTPTTIL